jgi:hypothetical protein
LDGTQKTIVDVQLDDILENGEKVYGTVELDGAIVSAVGGYDLGEGRLFHLLTDRGTFRVGGGRIIKDYNDAIDRFLL